MRTCIKNIFLDFIYWNTDAVVKFISMMLLLCTEMSILQTVPCLVTDLKQWPCQLGGAGVGLSGTKDATELLCSSLGSSQPIGLDNQSQQPLFRLISSRVEICVSTYCACLCGSTLRGVTLGVDMGSGTFVWIQCQTSVCCWESSPGMASCSKWPSSPLS